ncbi:MAG: PEP-CTERM sorting domain-containing protein [Planctomycetota bacterium]
MFKKTALATAAGIVSFSASHAALADSAVINFTSSLAESGFSVDPGVINPDALNPFAAGSELNDLVNGVFGPGEGLGTNLDWLRFTGQIYIPDFSGDGTYEITPTNGVGGIYLHSPLLNRIEAVSVRTEGALTAASIAAGAGRADGNPTQNRDDFYFPDFTPNGTATVTINGSDVTIDYDLDFSTLSGPNSQFFREETTDTDLSDRLTDARQQFGFIGVDGTATAVVQSAVIGSGDEDEFAYGAYNPLSEVLNGNLANTIVPSTRFVVSTEIAAGNITTDGRLTSDPSTPTELIPDPFIGETGDTFFYDLTGAGDLSTSILLIPEPGTAALLLAAAGVLVARRRQDAA